MTDDLERSAGVTAGEILAEKYRVERVLGVGGMGVVVAARHLELEERVAIKFLLPAMLQDGTAVARFQREARAAVRIKSEHVARVFDVGRLPNGAPYMVMEFLEGMDLAAWMERSGALPVAQAVDFLVQACVAVAEAHSLGIIHRDLKPANLFCVRRADGQPSVKVLDFGISKLADTAGGGGMSFTQTSAMMGSPLYMSPEQFRSSKNVDARTDIWALGSILFELVTGKTPFVAGTVTELAILVATERAPSAASVNRGVPGALASVIAKCLEPDPNARFRDVGELTSALAPFASPAARSLIDRVVGIVGAASQHAGVSAPPSVPLSHVEGRTAPALHYTSPDSARMAARKSNVAVTLGLLGALALIGAGGLWWWRTHGDAPVTTAALSATPVATVEVTATATPAATTPPPPPTAAAPPLPSPTVAPAEPEPATSGPAPLAAAPRAKGKRGAPSSPAAPAPARPTSAPVPPSPAPAPAPASRNSCDPPFYFDSKGNRVFKQECL